MYILTCRCGHSSNEVMSIEKCPSCLLITWPKPHGLDEKTGKSFSLFYEINCAEVKGCGKLVAITEGLELCVAGLNYSTEYECFVTPITSHGHGSASNIVVKVTRFVQCWYLVQIRYPCIILNVTGKPDVIAITKMVKRQFWTKSSLLSLLFLIIDVLALLALCLRLCLCIMCCCRSSKWTFLHNSSKLGHY